MLERLASTKVSSEEDSIAMQALLHRVGFPVAIVVCGVAYPDGAGRPTDVHTMASIILNALTNQTADGQ